MQSWLLHRDGDKLQVRVHVLVLSKLSLMAENRGF